MFRSCSCYVDDVTLVMGWGWGGVGWDVLFMLILR